MFFSRAMKDRQRNAFPPRLLVEGQLDFGPHPLLVHRRFAQPPRPQRWLLGIGEQIPQMFQGKWD